MQAIALLQRLQSEIALVLLDIVMPQMDGFAVLTIMNQQGWLEDVPVIDDILGKYVGLCGKSL